MTPPFPDKKYSVIYADPAWECNDDLDSPKRGAPDYPYMKLADIKALPVRDISENDALLFLWVRSPALLEGIETGQSWGFNFSTVAFVWDKHNPVVGHYTMSQCELCLVFKRGKIPQPRGKRNIRQFLSVKKGKHSVKPYEVRQRITEMFPHHEIK